LSCSFHVNLCGWIAIFQIEICIFAGKKEEYANDTVIGQAR